MEIYTSYYAKASRMDLEDCLLVKVSNTQPDWFIHKTHVLTTDVYPDWSLINSYKNGEISYEKFGALYTRQITSHTQPEFILQEVKNLCKIHDKEKVVFLCYEKEIGTCHRLVLAEMVGKDFYRGEL